MGMKRIERRCYVEHARAEGFTVGERDGLLLSVPMALTGNVQLDESKVYRLT